MPSENCLICGSPVPADRSEPSYETAIACPVCGHYRLTEYAAQIIFEIIVRGGGPPYGASLSFLENRYLISAAIRERYEAAGRREVRIEDVDSLLHSAHALQDPSEAVDRILLHVARITPRIGDLVQLHANDYPIAFARDYREFQNLQDLGGEMGFLDVQEHGIRPTPEGWYRIAELRVRSVDPTQAFVAMSYHDGLNTAYLEGIRPALEETGYTSIRVDFIEHNDKIGDRIVAEIRKSALIVADFTGHRPNVYFEAGLALGLGRHVIWTCHADAIEEAHFDTRQYNHIVWHDPADLRTRLRNRIEATIPIPSHIARTH